MYLHELYHRAVRRQLFNRVVLLVRKYTEMALVEQVILRGLTEGENGETQAIIAHLYSPFHLHTYPASMIEELQP